MPAKTAEALMRARYAAYTQGDIGFIQQTMCGKAAEGFNPIEAKQWATSVTWLGLNVIQAAEEGDHGCVEFFARYRTPDQQLHFIHEVSQFQRIDGDWFYFDGKTGSIQRNQPCPCASGKKFKKCCGA